MCLGTSNENASHVWPNDEHDVDDVTAHNFWRQAAM